MGSVRRSDSVRSQPLRFLLWQPLAVCVYLCLPRAMLLARVRSSEFQFTYSFFDQTLAYAGLLLGLYHAFRCIPGDALRRALIRTLIVWMHVDFVLRYAEAALMYQFDIGYSSLFFYHLQWESVRLALSQYWSLVALAVTMVAGADWVLRHALIPIRVQLWKTAAGAATVFMLLLGARDGFVLCRQRSRAPEDFAVASLVINWHRYVEEQKSFERINLTTAERHYLQTLGIGLRRLSRPPVHSMPPARRLNLITVYLEGFQGNFTQAGHGPFSGLTPNLDRFASRSLYMSSFYNAVTPTINALISSQCGILSEVENESLEFDRGYTRNLTCLPDVLHAAGYHQEFLGGADSAFAGKRLFLKAHQYDDVWGWEQWGQNEVYAASGRRNAWGLNDTDLMREAILRLPALADEAPFHLSLLTVDTHQPGYPEPECPEYAAGRPMLNAIHCTDYAFGLLLDALEREGLMNTTAIIVMGDHMMFPTPESAVALGSASADWFGKVFMAVSAPGIPEPATFNDALYTPDFAPIALDVLGFRPLPRFAFGRSPISRPDPRRTLVAAHFQILNGRMVPKHPTMDEECSAEVLEHTSLNPSDPLLSACGREKIIDFVDDQLLSKPTPPRSD